MSTSEFIQSLFLFAKLQKHSITSRFLQGLQRLIHTSTWGVGGNMYRPRCDGVIVLLAISGIVNILMQQFSFICKTADVHMYQRPLSGTILVVQNPRQHKHIVIYIVHYVILLGWSFRLQMARLLDTCQNHFETDGLERCGTARTPSLHVALLLRGSRFLRRRAADVRH